MFRFSNAEIANSLAVLIPSLGRSVEVIGALPAERIPIIVKFRYPWPIVGVSMVGFGLWVLLFVGAILTLSLVGAIFVLWLFSFVPRLLIGPMLSSFVKPVPGSLRLEGGRTALYRTTDWFYPKFSELRLEQSGAFVFKMGFKTVEIRFSSEADRTKALAWMPVRRPRPAAS